MGYTLILVCPWCGYSETFDPEDSLPEKCPACGSSEILIMAYRSLVHGSRDTKGEEPKRQRFSAPIATKMKPVAPIFQLEPGIFRVDLERLFEAPVELAEEGVGRFRLLTGETGGGR